MDLSRENTAICPVAHTGTPADTARDFAMLTALPSAIRVTRLRPVMPESSHQKDNAPDGEGAGLAVRSRGRLIAHQQAFTMITSQKHPAIPLWWAR
jgi:hypothetical protein